MINPANELKKKLKKEGLTQVALAKRLKVHESHISHVLSGLREPSDSVLAYLGIRRVKTVAHYEWDNGR